MYFATQSLQPGYGPGHAVTLKENPFRHCALRREACGVYEEPVSLPRANKTDRATNK